VLNDLAGDCDDFSILLGALLEATGHPVRIVIVGYHADRPDLYTHVFLETLVQDRWIPMDSTLPVPLGVTARYAHRRIIHLPRAKRFARGTKSAA
jgi:transglutaminase-like putative cysteine protease